MFLTEIKVLSVCREMCEVIEDLTISSEREREVGGHRDTVAMKLPMARYVDEVQFAHLI